jgi:glycosyltransferase involved in cell wall biosynthesis
LRAAKPFEFRVRRATPSLSVVVPLYNEQDNVQPLLDRIQAALADYPARWELIVVDDGSIDDTHLWLCQAETFFGAHLRVIRFPRNHGQTAAMQAGIDAARGELIATLDGDLQNDPQDLPRMVEELLVRDLDLLVGRRARRRDAWLHRRLPSRIANALIARVTGVRIHDYGCSLKVYRASMIKQVRLYGEMHRFIPVWAAMVTAPARIGETEVRHHPRVNGRSKYGLSRSVRVLLDLLTAFFFLRFQARPGHFFGAIGLALGGVGGAIMSYLAWAKFGLGEDIGTRPLLFVAILLLMGAAQFVTTGVLAELLSRLYQQTAARSPAPLPPMDSKAGWHEPTRATERCHG